MVALVMATAIWLLIRGHLISEGIWVERNPKRAEVVTSEEIEAKLLKLNKEQATLEELLKDLKEQEEE